jgi:Fibrinogen beta and gamma chains, C-terminal globular domain
MNTTVNVTLPSTASPVPLMSVAGWLTIFSRIDASFPTGLSASSYIGGFGDINSNVWLGLEKIYRLTNNAVNGGIFYSLRFELLQGSDNRYCHLFA